MDRDRDKMDGQEHRRTVTGTQTDRHRDTDGQGHRQTGTETQRDRERDTNGHGQGYGHGHI
jgi:hypothetical protein